MNRDKLMEEQKERRGCTHLAAFPRIFWELLVYVDENDVVGSGYGIQQWDSIFQCARVVNINQVCESQRTGFRARRTSELGARWGDNYGQDYRTKDESWKMAQHLRGRLEYIGYEARFDK